MLTAKQAEHLCKEGSDRSATTAVNVTSVKRLKDVNKLLSRPFWGQTRMQADAVTSCSGG